MKIYQPVVPQVHWQELVTPNFNRYKHNLCRWAEVVKFISISVDLIFWRRVFVWSDKSPILQVPQHTYPMSREAPFRTFLFWYMNGALGDMGQVYWGICEIRVLPSIRDTTRRNNESSTRQAVEHQISCLHVPSCIGTTNTLHVSNPTPSPPLETVFIRQVRCFGVKYDTLKHIVFDMHCHLIDKHIYYHPQVISRNGAW